MESNEQALLQFLQIRRDEMKCQFNRVLPSNELLFSRWEKAAYLGMGKGSSIYDTSVVMGDLSVGENVWIGPYTLLEAIHGKITIGDFVSINSGVMIFTHDSSAHYLSGGISLFEKGDVSIGDNTVIGSMSIIRHGITIGNRCLVGANSFVTKNVPDWTIVAGNPAFPIGHVKQLPNGEVQLIYSQKEIDK